MSRRRRPDLAPSPAATSATGPGRRALERKAISRVASCDRCVWRGSHLAGGTVARRSEPEHRLAVRSMAVPWTDLDRERRRRDADATVAGDGRSRPRHGRVAPRPVCMLTHSYYEEDPRVRREAESLVAAGRPVEVFALRRPEDDPRRRRRRRPRPPPRRAAPPGRRARPLPRANTWRSSRAPPFAATAANRRARFALVQVHTLPDFLVFAGAPLPAGRHPAGPRPARGDAGVLPDALPARLEPASSSARSCSQERAVDPRRRRRHHGQRRARRATRRARRAAGQGHGRAEQPRPRAVRPRPLRATRVHGRRHAPPRLRGRPHARPTRWTSRSTRWPSLRDARPDLPVALDVYGRGDAADAVARSRPTPRAWRDAVAFHGRIPIEDVPAALAAADIGLAPTRRTDVHGLQPLDQDLRVRARWASRSSRRALPLVERTFPPGPSRPTSRATRAAWPTAILRLVDDPLEREARVVADARRASASCPGPSNRGRTSASSSA